MSPLTEEKEIPRELSMLNDEALRLRDLIEKLSSSLDPICKNDSKPSCPKCDEPSYKTGLGERIASTRSIIINTRHIAESLLSNIQI